MKTISSQALAEQFHLNAAQIRKDLAYFGEFGVRGVGYYVKELRTHLRQILGLDRRRPRRDHGRRQPRPGARRLSGFRDEGFEIAALFDSQREKIGQRSRGGVPIYDVRDLPARRAQAKRISIAVIAVPPPSAQAVLKESRRRPGSRRC